MLSDIYIIYIFFFSCTPFFLSFLLHFFTFLFVFRRNPTIGVTKSYNRILHVSIGDVSIYFYPTPPILYFKNSPGKEEYNLMKMK